jgi:hypothetical protein
VTSATERGRAVDCTAGQDERRSAGLCAAGRCARRTVGGGYGTGLQACAPRPDPRCYAKIALCVASVADREKLRGLAARCWRSGQPHARVLAIPSPVAITITPRSQKVVKHR